jgi:hypothetical protein
VKVSPYKSEDGLGLVTVVPPGGDGMTKVGRGPFPFFPNISSNFVGIFISLFNSACKFQSFSNVRISRYLVKPNSGIKKGICITSNF